MCVFNTVTVQSMFKHVAFENDSLALILQSYSQIFIVKHTGLSRTEWTIKHCEISSVNVSVLVTNFQISKEVL